MSGTSSNDRASLERRRHRRFQVATTAAVDIGARHLGVFAIDNLSAGGASLYGELSAVALGSALSLRVGLAGAYPLQLAARLLRFEQRGSRPRFVVAFDDVSAAVEERIEEVAAGGCAPPAPSALVVTDNPGVQESLWFELWRLGRGCICVSTPLEAVLSLQEQQSAIEIAVVALSLPSGAGTDVLAFAAHHYPSVRRVLFADSTDRERLVSELAAGHVDAILIRPWLPRALAAAVGATMTLR